MRFVLVAAGLLSACAGPASWRPNELASVPALSFEPTTGSLPADDLAMGVDGALLLPSPSGGAPIQVPHQRPLVSAASLRLAPLDPRTPLHTAPGLGSALWQRGLAPAPFHSGVELYRSRAFKLLIGTQTLIDDRYPDAVSTDIRHEPLDPDTAAVVGVRLGF
jgi:hypothetical protein